MDNAQHQTIFRVKAFFESSQNLALPGVLDKLTIDALQ